jgi:phosphoserine phosphatase RsbU/P
MMPELTGVEVCTEIRAAKLRFQPYLILLTARHLPEDAAAALDAGADDYMTKPYSPVELRARLNVGKRYLEQAEQVKILRGLLPICSYCKRIRDDENYWHQLEEYLMEHAEVRFSHSLCPECLRKQFPALAEKLRAENATDQPAKPSKK